MKRFYRFLDDLYRGIFENHFPWCCVWSYSWYNLLYGVSLREIPYGIYRGCWGISDCRVGYVHCRKCQKKAHKFGDTIMTWTENGFINFNKKNNE